MNLLHTIIKKKIQQGSKLNQNLPPAVLEDGNTVAWYDYNQADTLTVDGSNYVSRWNDRLESGHDLIQETGTNQPLLTNDGVLCDGIDNWMGTNAFTYIQPEFLYLVLRQVSWADYRAIINGRDAFMQVVQRVASPRLRLFAGKIVDIIDAPLIGQDAIIRILFNAANSKYVLNNNTPLNVDTGKDGGSNGIRIATSSGTPSTFSNVLFKEMIFRKVADNATDEAAIYAYLKKKYAL